MNDAYSFDVGAQEAHTSYALVQAAYRRIFERLGVEPVVVPADCGDIGGSLSHEYHLTAEVGDDKVLAADGTSRPSIEVAHTFVLGDRYSRPLSSLAKDASGDARPVTMGCYGIGASRLLAAIQEHHVGARLRWPSSIAPFDAYVIPKTSPVDLSPFGSCLVDDRDDRSVSWKMRDAEMMGICNIAIVHATSVEMFAQKADGTYDRQLDGVSSL